MGQTEQNLRLWMMEKVTLLAVSVKKKNEVELRDLSDFLFCVLGNIGCQLGFSALSVAQSLDRKD